MSVWNLADEMEIATHPRVEAAAHPVRPFFWSVRRELWENPSIFIAPLAVAAAFEIGFVITALRNSFRIVPFIENRPDAVREVIAAPFLALAFAIFLTSFLVACFYSLDALYGERRDRSLYFWKSLPVSDLSTVAAKITVPLVAIPAVAFAVTIAAHIVLLLLGSVFALFIGGPALKILWSQLPLPLLWIELAYALVITTLWYAPIYAWLLLASVWARRAAFLWAVLPFVVLALLDKLVFQTHVIADLLKSRFGGQFLTAFAVHAETHQAVLPLSALTPGRFLASPGLWLGLAVALVLFVIVVRIRRYREPI